MDSNDAATTRNPIRTAIVGYGLSGKIFHGPFVKVDGDFVVSAIVTSSPVRQREASVDHPCARIYSTFDQLLEHETNLDVVIISSPPETHVEFATRALQHGVAVIVDKPFVPTVEDARMLEETAIAAGRPLMVFHNRRWDGDFLTLRRLLAEGVLGEVFAFESTFEHWAPVATDGWKDQLPTDEAGGVAYDLGSHLIDQALVLFGPADVRASSLRSVRRGGNNDDHSRIDLRHRSGVESTLLMSRVSRGLGPRFRVLGTRGSFTSTGLDGQERSLVAGLSPRDSTYGITPAPGYGTLEVEGPDGVTTIRVPMERGDYAEFYRRAALAIRDGKAVPVSLDDATAVVRLLEASARRTAESATAV